MALPEMVFTVNPMFKVTIDGIEIPAVIEVSGLKMELDKIDLKANIMDGGKYLVHQVPGRHKPGEFTVTRGLTDSKTISDWYKSALEGDLVGARKTASVEMLDFTGATLKTFEYKNCWVRSIELSGFKAGATEPATEKFIVCYDEVEVS